MTTILRDISFKTERDLLLVNILSALLVVVIVFFPNSPARIVLGLPVILFFSGYVLICALFPREEDLDWVERLALSIGLGIAVTSLIGLMLNYTPFGDCSVNSVKFFLFLPFYQSIACGIPIIMPKVTKRFYLLNYMN